MTLKAKKPDTLSSSIYEEMRQDILVGRLKAGEKLTMAAAQLRYSAGISPIREALSRLVPEGLVEKEEQKGFWIQSLTKADLAEITQMRYWLEDIAIRESIRLGDSSWEESIVVAQHRLSGEARYQDESDNASNPGWEQLHDEFHLALISACGSKRLLHQCHNFQSLTERYRRNDLAVDYAHRDANQEHLAIMKAAIDRDADTASRLLQEHCRLTAEHIMKSLSDT
jgi:GntR family carbon starvation induced transcriptional regulator